MDITRMNARMSECTWKDRHADSYFEEGNPSLANQRVIAMTMMMMMLLLMMITAKEVVLAVEGEK